jgi:protein SCO1/2
VYGERLTRDQLGEPLRRLLRGAPLKREAPLADLIERVRIICTVYDPETGTYRFKYGLLIEIAGGVTFLGAMLWFFALEWRNRRRSRRAPDAVRPLLARASK